MNRIVVQYFASLRQERGVSEELVETSAGNVRDLYDELSKRSNAPSFRNIVRVAVNDQLVGWSTPLSDGDTVVFLTPFGGG